MDKFPRNTDIIVNTQEELDRVLDILYNPKPLDPSVIRRLKAAQKRHSKVQLIDFQ